MPLRDEILRGDLRALYLGWLAGVCYREVEDDVLEPPPPPGLSRLTGAQQSLVQFLEIDEDLVTAAGAAEPLSPVEEVADKRAQEAWLAQLPADESAAVLKLLLGGQGQQAERQLRSAFLSWQRAQRPAVDSETRRRTVAELWSLAEGATAVRQQQESAKRKKAEAERNTKREAYLRAVAANRERHWESAEKDAQRGGASGYYAVKRTLIELAEAYTLCATRADFDQALADFMLRHGTRTALVKRLIEAGLWRRVK